MTYMANMTLHERFVSNVVASGMDVQEANTFYEKFYNYMQYMFFSPSQAFKIDTEDVYHCIGCDTRKELDTLVSQHLQQNVDYKLIYRGSRTRLSPNGFLELCIKLNTPPSHRAKTYVIIMFDSYKAYASDVLANLVPHDT